MYNLVEMFFGDGDNFCQPCKHGNLVDGHAVYCHNEAWKDAPRKCRRTWFTGGVERDEDCEGFAPNDRVTHEAEALGDKGRSEA